jgi:hypothetical protein
MNLSRISHVLSGKKLADTEAESEPMACLEVAQSQEACSSGQTGKVNNVRIYNVISN